MKKIIQNEKVEIIKIRKKKIIMIKRIIYLLINIKNQKLGY
jgi:hypothetical protein